MGLTVHLQSRVIVVLDLHFNLKLAVFEGKSLAPAQTGTTGAKQQAAPNDSKDPTELAAALVKRTVAIDFLKPCGSDVVVVGERSTLAKGHASSSRL